MNFWGLFFGVKHLLKKQLGWREASLLQVEKVKGFKQSFCRPFFSTQIARSVIFVVINVLVVLCFNCFFSGTPIRCEAFHFCCSCRRVNKGTNC